MENYEAMELEIIAFEREDIVTASSSGQSSSVCKSKDIELPIIAC